MQLSGDWNGIVDNDIAALVVGKDKYLKLLQQSSSRKVWRFGQIWSVPATKPPGNNECILLTIKFNPIHPIFLLL